jgi:hypothetical protein
MSMTATHCSAALMKGLPDVRGKAAERSVPAIHASTRRLHSNAWRIPPHFDALAYRFQHRIVRAFNVDLSEDLGKQAVIARDTTRHGKEVDGNSPCPFSARWSRGSCSFEKMSLRCEDLTAVEARGASKRRRCDRHVKRAAMQAGRQGRDAGWPRYVSWRPIGAT